MEEQRVDVAILGAGTAGNDAVRQVRRAGKSFVLINGGPLGTTCARVGCMPSKVLIHAADVLHERRHFSELGLRGGEDLRADIPAVLARVRSVRDLLVGRLIGRTTAKLDEQFIEGYARLEEPDLVVVGEQRIRAERVIVATGSRPIVPKPWQAFGERILTTDTLFEQEDLPPRMAVIGLGVIGVEMGQALARLGIRVTGFDALDRVAGISDPELNDFAIERFSQDFPLHLGEAAQISEEDGALRVSNSQHSALVDKVLVSIGRAPNTAGLGLEEIGAPLDERGRPRFDPATLQVGDLPIYLAGDVTGERAILHEATDEGRIAGFNASHGEAGASFRRKAPLGVVFTDPNVASVGASLADLDPDQTVIGETDFATLGRAIAIQKNYGRLRLYAERESGRLLGAAMCVPGGEHLAHLLAWSVEQGLSVADLQRMPYYHPVLEEGLGRAVDDLASKLAGAGEDQLASVARLG
ncbi:MAG TPA: dihydrolipoyl dehydrogenase [Planctomycetes bacterium]|nr:dihydrolipoyl dehydrogenase [Planctomycetota bacterium]